MPEHCKTLAPNGCARELRLPWSGSGISTMALGTPVLQHAALAWFQDLAGQIQDLGRFKLAGKSGGRPHAQKSARGCSLQSSAAGMLHDRCLGPGSGQAPKTCCHSLLLIQSCHSGRAASTAWVPCSLNPGIHPKRAILPRHTHVPCCPACPGACTATEKGLHPRAHHLYHRICQTAGWVSLRGPRPILD